MRRSTVLAAVAAAGLALFAGQSRWARRSYAADHLDPPARTNPDMGGTDRNADIADIYAWHRGEGANRTLVAVLSFSGPNAPSATQRMACDRNVLYGIHIDTTGDAMAEFNIRARVAPDDRMNCFVRWEGIPGAAGIVDTPAELVRTVAPNTRVFAGLRDDAFFFDLQGFRETLAMGATAPAGMGIRMTNDRDFFAGKNTSAFVIEVPLSALNNATNLKVWVTSARIGM